MLGIGTANGGESKAGVANFTRESDYFHYPTNQCVIFDRVCIVVGFYDCAFIQEKAQGGIER